MPTSESARLKAVREAPLSEAFSLAFGPPSGQARRALAQEESAAQADLAQVVVLLAEKVASLEEKLAVSIAAQATAKASNETEEDE